MLLTITFLAYMYFWLICIQKYCAEGISFGAGIADWRR